MLNDRFTLCGPDEDRRSLLLLLLIAFVVLAAGLGLRDPWPADEPRFALVAKHMVESGQWLFPFRGGQVYPDKPPLFMWCIAVLYRITGSMRVAFLLPSLIAGMGCLALVHDLGRRLWDRRTAFRAGLLLLFTIQFTAQAKLAQIDMLVTGFITLGVYGFLRFLLCGGGWRWYYLGWFAAGLGVITKGVGILAPLVLIPACWTHRDELRAAGRKAWLKGLAGPLVMVLAISLWLVPMLLVVQASHDSVLLGYRNDILFRQTVTRYAESWHHVQPFWYYVVEV
ncbi:MAG TPA: glycosyltransferase family 39 protein, partial [Holophaga sp.]|nr:glycosyltransferase family 39 protein [Holophaga sp.]